MNFLEKLTKASKELITNEEIVKILDKILNEYKNWDDLIEEEKENCEKIYNILLKKYPASLGIKPPKKEVIIPEINVEELLSELKEGKSKRKEGKSF